MSFLANSSLRSMLRTAPGAAASARSFSSSSSRSMARMYITGYIATQPEIQATSTGKEIIRYTVSSSRGFGENRTISYWRVSSFQTEGPQRDFMLGLKKGAMVLVEADASMRVWEDANGKKQSTLNVTQRSLEHFGSRPRHQDQNSKERTEEQTSEEAPSPSA